MLAQFSIWALDDPHLRNEMATIRQLLEDEGFDFDMKRMSTTIEGSFEQITSVIGQCHERLSESHKRLLVNITIDDDRA
ncbi:thiamine-binding protein [Bythopirellula goksoeyrii]|uniref:Thiamine-binding protein domain-containing protein n=1 Tax=Bythopirellula goksoeyrii TaxID=1400387 RepID=A0A5B9QH58_9BACT|nr:thiamine-binding protein [Bythopirellula goksoeyrii]QEG36942.1 hypothetical protein Pr1d_42820 [Bythopirellula goksoeyrii]